MSAFSRNRRRILSLWLPRLPIDRIKRQFESNSGARAEHAPSYPSPREAVGRVGSHAAQAECEPGWGAFRATMLVASPSTLASASLRPSLPTASRGEGLNRNEEPCIVVAKENNALKIYSLDDAATQLGLDIGQPLANARAICPNLRVFDADEAADARTLNDIADCCDRFTPLVALDPPHGLFLDITGCAHLFGGEAAMLRLVCDLLIVQGFTVVAAIASTATCARTLTRHVHGAIVPEGQEADAVGPLPVSALGADAAITTGLRRAGLKMIGDVASRARHEITARFGAAFTGCLEQALGQGDAPINPRKPLPDFIVEKRFAEPVATDTAITATLSRLAQMLTASMAQQGKGARRCEACFFRTDGAVRAIAVDTGQAVTKPEVIDHLFRERLETLNDPLDPGFGFDLIRLSASHTEIVVQQQHDLDAHVHDNDELSALLDRIAARIGSRRVIVYMPQETHIPERTALAVPAQQHLAASIQTAWQPRAEGEPPLRPLRLFERPEQIQVIAQVPDGPPARFVWRRATHSVVRAEGPERIAMEWWRSDGAGLTRDYFRVEDEAGLRFWLYRDGLYEREVASQTGQPVQPSWFMHGLFA